MRSRDESALYQPVVALFNTGLYDYFENPMLEDARELLSHRGLELIIRPHYEIEQDCVCEMRQLMRSLRRPVGMILIPPPSGGKLEQFLTTEMNPDFPLVALDRSIYAANIPAVLADHLTGTSKAVEQFARLGYANMHFVGANPAIQSIGLRWEGFKDKCGQEKPRYWRVPSFGEPEELDELEQLIEVVRTELRSGAVGVVAAEATTAKQFVARFLKNSTQVPPHLGILHYDSLRDSGLRDGDYIGLAQRKEELMTEAVKLLLMMIDGKPIPDRFHRRVIPAVPERAF